ncbi:MAG: di-trans,poly-cis-decaprenylcistransferase [Euryarchaeota archaeon]|nr:di-trans,poly-cis-decaprenylcistransferase [Euryarchaeota archaeon]
MLSSRPGTALRSRVERAQCARILREVRKRPVPHHVAIIMDGNRRFARKGGGLSTDGHLMGRDKLEEVLEWCLELGIRVLTVYAFSTENFKRDDEEVQLLMDLFERNYYRLADDPRVHKHKIRFRTIGKKELLPERVRAAAEHAEEVTRDHDQYHFNVAVAYGGREEILNAVRRISEEVRAGRLTTDEIDEELFSSHLYTNELPDPDLILRTSGEERISNFLLWQLAYSELYFSDVFWPGLRKKEFLRAIQAYQKRQRRFGGDTGAGVVGKNGGTVRSAVDVAEADKPH